MAFAILTFQYEICGLSGVLWILGAGLVCQIAVLRLLSRYKGKLRLGIKIPKYIRRGHSTNGIKFHCDQNVANIIAILDIQM